MGEKKSLELKVKIFHSIGHGNQKNGLERRQNAYFSSHMLYIKTCKYGCKIKLEIKG